MIPYAVYIPISVNISHYLKIFWHLLARNLCLAIFVKQRFDMFLGIVSLRTDKPVLILPLLPGTAECQVPAQGGFLS